MTANSSAALGGGFGLQAIVDDTAPRYVSDWSPVSLRSYASRFYFDPNSISMASGNSHVLFRALDFAARTAFQIELRSYQGEYQIRAYAPWDSGGSTSTPWLRIHDDLHSIEAIWQASSAEGAMDGALALWLDGELAASGSGIDNDTRRVDKVDLGAVAGLDSGTSGAYYFDAFASTAGIPNGADPGTAVPTPPSPADEIFTDGFESGSLSAWSARKNEGDLLVNGDSALAGGYGLEAIADDTAPRYVTDWSPMAEKEYHVRFVFDPNSLTMLDARSHVMFQALSGSSKVIARVELRYKSLNYELRSGVLTDANQWLNTGWWYIDDGPQVIELDWRAASRPDTSDGSLTMRINEEPAEILDGIYNSLQQVDLAQLGLVVGVDSGTLGSMRFDAFESRRWGHIGLPDDLATPVPTGTQTGTPTETPTLTPTGTSTLTPTPDCGNIVVNLTFLSDPYVRMLVTNQNPYPIHQTDSTISWEGPGLYPGQTLGGMYFDGYYWIGNDPVSPSSHAPAPPIAVSPWATAPWYGYFLNAPALFGTYSVTLTFDDTCVVSGSVNRDPPTMTATSTPIHTKTPAGTLGPSATFTPTPVPPGTATVTATPTAGAASCELIHIERFGYAWDRMFVKVVNNNAVPVSLTGSYIEWPDSGDGYLDWLEFGARYYEGDDPEPPTSVSLSPPIALAGDSSEFWIAGFPYGVVGWLEDWWDIELEFDNVCKVSLGFSILTPTPTWVP